MQTKTAAAIFAATLTGCATSPYLDLADQVKRDVAYVRQQNDPFIYGCEKEGDCDDRALCAACRLVSQGANPGSIMVVIEGWKNGDRRARDNHMSIEYDGSCILGYGSRAYLGPCKHWYDDKQMTTMRLPLPVFLQLKAVDMRCPAKL